MKAMDTPVLLGLLQGDPRARALLRRWRGVEVATTEANLLELYSIIARSRGPARAARLASLTRLRRDLTVLPIDSRSVEAAARRLPSKGTVAPLTLGMLGALEAYGCDELATDMPAEIPSCRSFPVTAYGRRTAK